MTSRFRTDTGLQVSTTRTIPGRLLYCSFLTLFIAVGQSGCSHAPFSLDFSDWHVDGCRWAYLEGVHPGAAHVEDTNIEGEDAAFVGNFNLPQDRYEGDSDWSTTLDIADPATGSFQVVDATDDGDGITLSDCNDLNTVVPGMVWSATAGSVEIAASWVETREGCAPEAPDHLYKADFAFSNLTLINTLGTTLEVSSFGPFEAEIGANACGG